MDNQSHNKENNFSPLNFNLSSGLIFALPIFVLVQISFSNIAPYNRMSQFLRYTNLVSNSSDGV